MIETTASGWKKALEIRSIIAVELIVSAIIVAVNFLMPTIVLLLFGSGSLWARGKSWKDNGFRLPGDFPKAVATGILAGLAWAIVNWFVFLPVVNGLTGEQLDLALFEGIRGDWGLLAVWLAVTWTLAAFGEELVYRGYLLNRLGDLLGKGRAAVAAGVLLASVLFGVSHLYQGVSGIAVYTLLGVYLSLLYLACNKNLWPAIIAHGVMDTLAFALVFMSV